MLITSATQAWRNNLAKILSHGDSVSPRGKLTKEILQETMAVDMRYPVIISKDRQLNYRFMAAEAYWILTGDNRVETIKPYNSRIAEFSDDGETFFGAYGPKVMDQVEYVVGKLLEDENSRQAGLTIWREKPHNTKDVPCTVAIFFSIRNKFVNAHVFMRSSDGWLGIPYDLFNFSMIGHYVCARLNESQSDRTKQYYPGTLYLTAASAHLYEENWVDSKVCIDAPFPMHGEISTPAPMFSDTLHLLGTLENLRNVSPGHPLRWWETK